MTNVVNNLKGLLIVLLLLNVGIKGNFVVVIFRILASNMKLSLIDTFVAIT